MTWFKVDDGFFTHPKVLSIPRDIRPTAIGAWLLAGTWCAKHLTDGLVPAHMLEELGITPAAADALLTARLWIRFRKDYRFKNWPEYQPTREQVEANRESERTRKAEQRKRRQDKQPPTADVPAGVPVGQARDTRWDTTGTPAGQERVSEHPDPTRPDPTTAPNGAVLFGPPQPAAEPDREKPRRPKRALPDDWQPTDAHIEAARTRRLNLNLEAERFRASALANDRRYANWNQAFTTWLLRAVPELRPLPRAVNSRPDPDAWMNR